MSMALVMSQMPDVIRKVLAEHVPDGSGRCAACRNLAGGVASWPCQTYRVAQEAQWVGEGNLPGTGPHGPVVPESRSSRPERDRTPGPRREPRSFDDDPLTGDAPEVGFGASGPGFGLTGVAPSSGGRRRRMEQDDDLDGGAPFGSRMDAPYGASFGVDDRPRHAR